MASIQEMLIDMVENFVKDEGKGVAQNLVSEVLGKHESGELKKEHVDGLNNGLASLIKPENLGDVANILEAFGKHAN